MPDSSPPASSSRPGLPPLIPAVGLPATRRTSSPRPASHRPLPDAVAVYPVAIPDPAPPYDDPAPRPESSAGSAPALRPRPTRTRDAARSETTRRRNTTRPETARATDSTPVAATSPSSIYDPWPSQFAQVLAETLAGSRPPGQIVPWTTEQTRRRISQLGPLLATAQRPRVRRVIVTCPARDVVEMTVIVGLGPRVRALAVRLERSQDQSAGQPPPTVQEPNATGYRVGRPTSARAGRADEPGRWYCTVVEAA